MEVVCMNIFVTDPSPSKSALALDDKRVVKMILESTQMLCTAINEHGGKSPYKSTHKNHPSNVWARETKANFQWLYDHAMALCIRYTETYGKCHKCMHVLTDILEQDLIQYIPDGDLTPFANCAANASLGVSFKDESNVFKAYKDYLNVRWDNDKREPTWGNSGPPKWRILNDSNEAV